MSRSGVVASSSFTASETPHPSDPLPRMVLNPLPEIWQASVDLSSIHVHPSTDSQNYLRRLGHTTLHTPGMPMTLCVAPLIRNPKYLCIKFVCVLFTTGATRASSETTGGFIVLPSAHIRLI